MTGDKVEKATMAYGNRSDIWVASKVRMLMRDDLDHEFVCVGARDRIMYLSQEVERLTLNPTLHTSTFSLTPLDADSVWLQKKGEEGAQISNVDFDAELQRIFEARF